MINALKISMIAIVSLAIFALLTPNANAHVIDKSKCVDYARIQTLVTKGESNPKRSYKACLAALQAHAYTHCRGTYRVKNACIIRIVFGVHGNDAVRVAICESGLSPYASNGQYLGMFQMGSSERARFGHGPGPITQAESAFKYFSLSGWSPWECQP